MRRRSPEETQAALATTERILVSLNVNPIPTRCANSFRPWKTSRPNSSLHCSMRERRNQQGQTPSCGGRFPWRSWQQLPPCARPDSRRR